MNVLVAYYSETGNTRKVAEAIFAGIETVHKKLLPIEEVEDFAAADLIFCGFPVIHHGLPEKITAFMKRIPDGGKIALFATHGSMRGGEKAVTAFFAALSLCRNQKVLGTFGCQGQVKSQLIETLMEKPQHRAWALESQGAHGHPDAADLEDAKAFAAQMLVSAKKFHGRDGQP